MPDRPGMTPAQRRATRWPASVMPAPAVLALCLSAAAPARAQDPPAVAPSFDCARAATPDERAICADDTLASLDRFVAGGFAQVRDAGGATRAQGIARDGLDQRRACGGDAACILASQRRTIAEFLRVGAVLPADVAGNRLPAPEGPPPLGVGECVAARIDSFGPRLEGADFDSGTGVAFTNGAGQVSYDREEGIIASKPGDPVQICLLSLPRGCPPGDDRGRVYIATNLATGAVWVLPDASHVCGGA